MTEIELTAEELHAVAGGETACLVLRKAATDRVFRLVRRDAHL